MKLWNDTREKSIEQKDDEAEEISSDSCIIALKVKDEGQKFLTLQTKLPEQQENKVEAEQPVGSQTTKGQEERRTEDISNREDRRIRQNDGNSSTTTPGKDIATALAEEALGPATTIALPQNAEENETKTVEVNNEEDTKKNREQREVVGRQRELKKIIATTLTKDQVLQRMKKYRVGDDVVAKWANGEERGTWCGTVTRSYRAAGRSTVINFNNQFVGSGTRSTRKRRTEHPCGK